MSRPQFAGLVPSLSIFDVVVDSRRLDIRLPLLQVVTMLSNCLRQIEPKANRSAAVFSAPYADFNTIRECMC